MANGYFARGEIYWVRVDGGLGSEQGIGRPGLIVSNNKANNAADTLNIVWMTTQNRTEPFDIVTHATGRRSFVMCNQIMTVDKVRLGKCLGVLPPDEQKQVDTALEDQFDLGYVDDAALKEKDIEIRALNVQMDELRAEIAKLKAEIDAQADKDIAAKVEIEMWQRLYGKALDQAVSMKLDGDIARRVEKLPEKSKVIVPEQPKTPEASDILGLVDVNSASFKQLKACGFSNNLVLTIIDKRPYRSIEDVKKLPGVTNVMWQIVSKKICCVVAEVEPKKPLIVLDVPHEPEEPVIEEVTEPAVEKVNINTCTALDLQEKANFPISASYMVTGYRKKHGNFSCVEDLLKVPQVYAGTLKRCGHLLEV